MNSHVFGFTDNGYPGGTLACNCDTSCCITLDIQRGRSKTYDTVGDCNLERVVKNHIIKNGIVKDRGRAHNYQYGRPDNKINWRPS